MKVVRISPPSGRLRHQRVVLDGGPALRLRADDVASLGLAAGVELDKAQLDVLRRRAEIVLATGIGLRLLAVRLRSRRELEERLNRRGIGAEAVRTVISRLTGEGLLDDARFARAWVQGRLAVRPAGTIRLRRELLGKGIAPEVIQEVLREAFSDSDEHRLALDVARARVRRYRSDPPEVAYRRLAGVLHRRGFSAGAVAAALRDVLGRAVPVVD